MKYYLAIIAGLLTSAAQLFGQASTKAVTVSPSGRLAFPNPFVIPNGKIIQLDAGSAFASQVTINAPDFVTNGSGGTAGSPVFQVASGSGLFYNGSAAAISFGSAGIIKFDAAGATILTGSFVGVGSGLTTLNAGNISSGTLSQLRGGTAFSGNWTSGAIPYGNGSGLTSLAPATGVVLGGTPPTIGTVNLASTSFVSGILAVANGGTGRSTEFPKFSANKNGSNQTVSASTTTKATFTTEAYDIGSFYDAANSKWVPPVGKVHIHFRLYGFSVGVGDNYTVYIYKNGAELARVNAVAGSFGQYSAQISVVDSANGTDFYEAYANFAAATTWDGTAGRSAFSGEVLP